MTGGFFSPQIFVFGKTPGSVLSNHLKQRPLPQGKTRTTWRRIMMMSTEKNTTSPTPENAADFVQNNGLAALRGHPLYRLSSEASPVFLSDAAIDAAIALWADEPVKEYRWRMESKSRLYGAEVRNANMVEWVYLNTVYLQPALDQRIDNFLVEPMTAEQIKACSDADGYFTVDVLVELHELVGTGDIEGMNELIDRKVVRDFAGLLSDIRYRVSGCVPCESKSDYLGGGILVRVTAQFEEI
jgi:hypothetical protein